MKIILEITTLDIPVKLEKLANSYRVTYGEHVVNTRSDIEAFEEFGLCCRHSAECACLLDNH